MKVKVVHSQSKNAWNIVNTKLGGKYKLVQVPYVGSEDEMSEALIHANLIAEQFNNGTIPL